jgi:hypothetical protein
VLQVLQVAEQQVLDVVDAAPIRRAGYRERMRSAFGRDPLVCPQCGRELWLWQIWHPHYGVVYDELESMKAGVYERVDRPLCGGVDSDRAGDAGPGPDSHVQLPLFALPACR